MTRTLWAHAAWVALASAFNAGSWMALSEGQPGWAGPGVGTAQAGVLVMGLVVGLGLAGWTKAYRGAAGCIAAVLLIGGVGRHLVADPAGYASWGTRLAGVGVNLFGVCGFAWGAVRGLDRQAQPTGGSDRS